MLDWATRFTIDHDGAPTDALVVVEADSAEAAATRTGLIREEWRPATEADLVEWDQLAEGELDDTDLDILDAAAAKAQQGIASHRRRLGRMTDDPRVAGFEKIARWRAWRIAVARARIQETEEA